MKLKQLTLKQSLNKAYRLVKPERAVIEKFKENFKLLLGHINVQESEENLKGHVMDFLKHTWYSPAYHIATKGRTDFVIHNGKDAGHPAGVLFEAKKPSNSEMVTTADLNRKAMHEIVLYYLRERIEHNNGDIRPVLNGGDIGKYQIKWNGEFIKYGDWLHRPRPSYIYDKPHLLIQRIRNPKLKQRLIATYDERKYISSDGLSNIILKEGSNDNNYLKFLLAIINSKLINYWFSFYFFDVNIKPEQLRRIPIKDSDEQIKGNIIKLVETVLDIKTLGAETKELENEIDRLVYKLYDLTEDEIKIIEAATK